MKNTRFKLTIISFTLFVCHLALSCKNNSSPAKNDSILPNVSNSNGNQLYSEGMKILNDRLSIQSTDNEKAMELNKIAIEKFSAAHKADTSLINPVLFASECTMYAKEYQNCIYWTLKLMRLDTSEQNQLFCKDRINYCNEALSN